MATYYHELTDKVMTDAQITEMLELCNLVESNRRTVSDDVGWYDNDGNYVYEFSDFQYAGLKDPSFIDTYDFHNTIKDWSDNSDWETNLYNHASFAWVDGSLDFHQDHRLCALSIPLVDFTQPIIWKNENLDTELATYNYTKGVPVLINTTFHHGSPNNTTQRIWFQVSLRETIDTVKGWFGE